MGNMAHASGQNGSLPDRQARYLDISAATTPERQKKFGPSLAFPAAE
jgi:hypothetical protein